MFATGIENSYPTIALPDGTTKRVDEMPYYATHTGPDKYDWEFSDVTFGELKSLGIAPIVDMPLFAEYASAFARRFPHLRFYTYGPG